MNTLKQQFLDKYYLLDFAEHETDSEMQDYTPNNENDNKLYDDMYMYYVTPILSEYECNGYNLDDVTFRSFVKDTNKPNAIRLIFDGLDKIEFER